MRIKKGYLLTPGIDDLLKKKCIVEKKQDKNFDNLCQNDKIILLCFTCEKKIFKCM